MIFLVVVLPTGYDNLCALDKDVAQDVDKLLYKYWKDGYCDSLPVLMMKTTGKFPNYQKEIFVQSFMFKSGNCIKDVGGKTLYYFLKADGVC